MGRGIQHNERLRRFVRTSGAAGDAGAVGEAEGGNTGASLDQEGVGVAVVAADELDELQFAHAWQEHKRER